jgi:FG-GAP-like repeat
VLTGSCQDSGFGIFLGNGDGTFRAGASYQASVRNGTWITGGDFNGDGKLDIALASTNCQFVPCPPGVATVFNGNGDGTFASPANFSTAPAPFFIVAGDINGDGKLDLITANNCTSNCGNAPPLAVSVLLGDGKGGFQKNIDTELDNGQYAFWVAVGDLNGDVRLAHARKSVAAGVLFRPRYRNHGLR